MRKRVQEFSQDVSKAMVCKEIYSFFTIPDACEENDTEDPQIHNDPRSLTSSNIGNNAASNYTRNHIFV